MTENLNENIAYKSVNSTTISNNNIILNLKENNNSNILLNNSLNGNNLGQTQSQSESMFYFSKGKWIVRSSFFKKYTFEIINLSIFLP